MIAAGASWSAIQATSPATIAKIAKRVKLAA
jgi:hypothetical protein